jgi:hypothetical protein
VSLAPSLARARHPSYIKLDFTMAELDMDLGLPSGEGRYNREHGVSLIEIRLNTIQQLFNSLDPAPFHEKDLDKEAEAYIVESAREVHRAVPIKIVLYVPSSEAQAAAEANVETAIRQYFAYRLWLERSLLRRELSYGRLALLIGLGFLFVCIALRQAVVSFGEGTFNQIVAEGLLISGWVAMWRPLQLFLYEWWPIHRNCRLFEKLAAVPVEVRSLP